MSSSSTPNSSSNSTTTSSTSSKTNVPGAFGLSMGGGGGKGPKKTVAQKVEDAEKKFDQLIEQQNARIEALEDEILKMSLKNQETPAPPVQPRSCHTCQFTDHVIENFKQKICGKWKFVSGTNVCQFLQQRHALLQSEGFAMDDCFADSDLTIHTAGHILKVFYTKVNPNLPAFTVTLMGDYKKGDGSKIRTKVKLHEEDGEWEMEAILIAVFGEELSRTYYKVNEEGMLTIVVKRYGMECWRYYQWAGPILKGR